MGGRGVLGRGGAWLATEMLSIREGASSPLKAASTAKKEHHNRILT